MASHLPKPVTYLTRVIAAGQKVVRHRHPWAQFICATSGAISVNCKQSRWLLSSEQGIWIPSNVDHQVHALTAANVISLYVEDELALPWFDELAITGLSALAKLLLEEAQRMASQADWNQKEYCLYQCLFDQLQQGRQQALVLPFPKAAVLQALTFAQKADPASGISLMEWGHKVGASERTLARRFKKETGYTWGQWQKLLKLQLAITFLAKGLSVTQIALELGYESDAAFIAMFRSQIGVPPGRFRQQQSVKVEF